MRLARWLVEAWRSPPLRAGVIGQYASLKHLDLVLADIATRGSVFNAHPPGVDLGIAEGRRQLALEIIRAAGADPQRLMTICFQPQKDTSDA